MSIEHLIVKEAIRLVVKPIIHSHLPPREVARWSRNFVKKLVERARTPKMIDGEYKVIGGDFVEGPERVEEQQRNDDTRRTR